MSNSTTVALLVIGTELTNGIIQDTHTVYMASKLVEAGFSVKKIVLVPDDDISAVDELQRLLFCCDSVILTGGLGPTSDDITRDILARVSGVRLVFRQDVWDDIVSRYDIRTGHSNKQQAFVPEHFSTIENTKGTAPGLKGIVKGVSLYALPGPPREMRVMFDSAVLPDLVTTFHTESEEYLEATCFLVCESGLEDACRQYVQEGITWGTRAEESGIRLYIRGGSLPGRTVFLHFLQTHFGKERVKEGSVDASSYIVSLFSEKGYSLSCAESCTGGLFSKLITDVPGSSNVFPGGVISYSLRTKAAYLHLDREKIEASGVVSGETAAQMARAVKEISGSDFGISFTGVAGPGGGSASAPVGTVWVGIAGPDGDTRRFPFTFRGSRSRIRNKAVLAGFLLLEIWVMDKKRLDSYKKWQYI